MQKTYIFYNHVQLNHNIHQNPKKFRNASKIGKVPITKVVGVFFFNSTFMCEKINFHSCKYFTIFVID
jgi:hypothetical protein